MRPSPSNFDWAISAFSLVKSRIVICAAEAAADDEGAAGSGAKAGAELVRSRRPRLRFKVFTTPHRENACNATQLWITAI